MPQNTFLSPSRRHSFTTPRALVVGAMGGIGSTMCARLLQEGWQVNGLARQSTRLPSSSTVNWYQGDALKPNDVVRASRDCEVILHAVNPPGYKHWDKWALPMLEATLEAAQQHKACVVVPGNIYNFDHLAGINIDEDMPQQPCSQKGHIRVMMEQRLEEFADQGGQVILLRCGDFFGALSHSNWLHQAIASKGLHSSRLLNPSINDQGHQWAYLPDVAETMMQLILRRDSLPNFARFHMAGHWDKDGHQITEYCAEVISQYTGKRPSIKAFPWWAIQMLAPFHRTSKELLEMRYLWQHPLRLDNSRLLATLGTEPHTPWQQAVTETLCYPRKLHRYQSI